MANRGQKNGVFHVRFRFQGKEYKKSLKTRNREDAEAAVHGVEQSIHLITIGKLTIPSHIDPADFILSGGTVSEPQKPRRNTLDARERLDDTWVIVTAEFGRTPTINQNAGRDHWPHD